VWPGELVGAGQGSRREETAVCMGDVHLAAVSTKDFERVIKR
jgi:hypothetical protein